MPAQPLHEAATLICDFIEGDHEKLEEEHLFPRFRKAGVLVSLVDTMQAQHAAGRTLTARILSLTSGAARRNEPPPAPTHLTDALQAFVRMYAPHEAREDTVLFPAFRRLLSEDEYEEMGEAFEERAHALFGKEGFESAVERVAAIERTLGIHDLAAFMPVV